MADVQIKKGALQGSLTREWRADKSRPAIERVPPGKERELVFLIDNVVQECSRTNVQKCSQFITTYVLPAEDRIKAFGAYLDALSKSFLQSCKTHEDAGERRLFLLWLLSDVLHHLREKRKTTDAFNQFVAGVDLVKLVTYAAQCCRASLDGNAIAERLRDLLSRWRRQEYFTDNFLEDLHNVLDGKGEDVDLITYNLVERIAGANNEEGEDSRFKLTGHYGEAEGDWFSQPAGVMLQQLSLSAGKRVRANIMKPIQTAKGQVEDDLMQAVQGFTTNATRDRFADTDPECVHSIDDLGQVTLKDTKTGALSYGETYYGFSRDFLETLKATEQWNRRAEENGTDTLDDVVADRGGKAQALNGTAPHWSKVHLWEAPKPAPPQRSPSTRRHSPSPRRRSPSPARRRSPSTPPRKRSPSPRPRKDASRSRSRSPSRSRSRSRGRRPRSPSPPDRYSRSYNRRSRSRDNRRDQRDRPARYDAPPRAPPAAVQPHSTWSNNQNHSPAPPPPPPPSAMPGWIPPNQGFPPPLPGQPYSLGHSYPPAPPQQSQPYLAHPPQHGFPPQPPFPQPPPSQFGPGPFPPGHAIPPPPPGYPTNMPWPPPPPPPPGAAPPSNFSPSVPPPPHFHGQPPPPPPPGSWQPPHGGNGGYGNQGGYRQGGYGQGRRY